jgi:hypothetical protein
MASVKRGQHCQIPWDYILQSSDPQGELISSLRVLSKEQLSQPPGLCAQARHFPLELEVLLLQERCADGNLVFLGATRVPRALGRQVVLSSVHIW